ncbi:D-amino-acid transaminase [Acidocella aromatica]|uniref:Probable branched-chain-amino-acid aminotransferase n=1 Tax=Acidocella aromatica TaxID=1303579 RepID=A0A840VN20_9PROT|nr:D-amino-acid transaminase [Acidocella aromatica]MBB5372850.1 D-alanine transaminase [Acidocella aromatica]
MPAIAYVNGRYLPLHQASVNVEDRGYQFGDGIYEVLYVYRGRLVDEALHLQRLARSLGEIELPRPMSAAALRIVIGEVLRRNRIETGLVYMQVTRGVARRDHPIPSPAPRPSLVITARRKPEPPADIADWTAEAITLPDERWGRCDIKSTNLLPNVLARTEAKRAGAYEAILYDTNGNVTEGAASTVWIVTREGTLLTRNLDRHILPGCTRAALVEALQHQGIEFEEREVSLDELCAAREIVLTSATSFVKPVVRLDGKPIGNGGPGATATALFELYLRRLT